MLKKMYCIDIVLIADTLSQKCIPASQKLLNEQQNSIVLIYICFKLLKTEPIVSPVATEVGHLKSCPESISKLKLQTYKS